MALLSAQRGIIQYLPLLRTARGWLLIFRWEEAKLFCRYIIESNKLFSKPAAFFTLLPSKIPGSKHYLHTRITDVCIVFSSNKNTGGFKGGYCS